MSYSGFDEWKMWAKQAGLPQELLSHTGEMRRHGLSTFEQRMEVRYLIQELAEGKGEWPPKAYPKMGPKVQELMRTALFIGLARREIK